MIIIIIIIINGIYIHLLLLDNTSDLLHNKIAVISSQIVKDNRNLELFRIDPHLQITILMSRSSITTCDMTVIPDSDIFIGICLVTNMALISLLKMLENGLKICVNYKWHGHLLVKVLEFQCIIFFFRHPNSLLTIDYHATALVSAENVWATEMLEATHEKILSLLMLGLIIHQIIKVLN